MALDPVKELVAALGSPDTAPLKAVLSRLEATYPGRPFTWYAKAELLRRQGDIAGALPLSATALTALLGQRALTTDGKLRLRDLLQFVIGSRSEELVEITPYFEQFGDLLERSRVTHRLDESLESILAPLVNARGPGFSPRQALCLACLLGMGEKTAEHWAQRVFDAFIVPGILACAERGQFDTALILENIAYRHVVKRRESQDWFRAATSRWIPGLAAAARRTAYVPALGHAQWRREEKRRIAFFLHNASLLAHVLVLLETLSAVREAGQGNYEFTVFARGVRNRSLDEPERMHAAFEHIGVHVRYLGAIEDGRHFDRLRELQRILREENFAICFWISVVTMMAVAFPMRIAPLQGWWAMKYHSCEIDEIDVHLAVENVVTWKTMEGHAWRTIGNASKRWIDVALEAPARELRAQFPADAVVVASIAREEKLNSASFLESICELLRNHPRMIFVWTGRSRHPGIRAAFERAGVAGRTHFAGWVDTKLYAMAIDIFLDTYPFPCGLSIKESMAAGKAVVMYRSPESLETGVPGAISSIIEKPESAPAGTYERMQAIFTRETPFDLYLCAESPAAYVKFAGSLIEDPGLRAATGEANRRYMEEFASSPRDEGTKFLNHLDELFETIPTAS